MVDVPGLAELTGLLALALVFLSGPYRTIQKKWRPSWGPVLSVWAHGNVSLAASLAVFLHVVIVGELEILPVEPSADPPLLTYVATGLFLASLESGLFGLYVAKAAKARQKWLRFHRKLTTVFYLALLPHVFTEGIIQWPVFLLLLTAWATFAWRGRLRDALARLTWPLGAPAPQTVAPRGRRRSAFVLATSLVLLGAGSTAAFLWPGAEREEEGLEVYGTVAEVSETHFVLATAAGAVRVVFSEDTEFEQRRPLTQLQREGAIVEVEGARQPDGSILASEVEIEAGEYGDQPSRASSTRSESRTGRNELVSPS